MTGLPVEPGLLERLRAAGTRIAWREATPRAAGRRRRGASAAARIAHLHDEEARVEEGDGKDGHALLVDSGPVGALVVLLEADRRGLPSRLVAHAAGVRPGFASGAIEAAWSGGPPDGSGLPLADLVALARYALA